MSESKNKPTYFTWSNTEELRQAMNSYSSSNDNDHIGITKSNYGGNYSRDFRDIDTNISVRSPYSRTDYEYFRGNEALPKNHKELIRWCMSAYKENGLIRNIVDLMGDFVTQGVRLVHPNKSVEAFYNWWWKRINGKNRTERIANMFYRTGTVVVRRKTGKIKGYKKKFALAEVDEKKVSFDNLPEFEKNEIPTGYIIHNPCTLDIVGGELAAFIGKTVYSINIPRDIITKYNKLKLNISNNSINVPYELDLFNKLPIQIKEALDKGHNSIILDPNKIESIYYKKDDWELWGQPMILAIIKDIVLLEKMKLADMTALDGIISSVRLWKVGDLQNKILPAPGTLRKLSNMLVKNTAGGAYDIVWGPDIDFKESNSNAYQALGKEKYEPTLNAIYAGLGIPPTLTGSATQSGFTNNFISIKTLIERLNYGRDEIVTFWEKEIAIVQKALGFKQPAKVVFDHMSLSDESAEKALLIQMWDRNIISNEAINERFKEDPEIERIRIQQENKMRKSGKMAPKAGQWFNAEKEHDLRKILTQLGELSPTQLGIELQPDDNDNIPNRRREKLQTELETIRQSGLKLPNDKRGQPMQGRPKNVRDSSKRKTKQVKPRQKLSSIGYISWAKEAYEKIDKIINPAILKSLNKTRIVALTNQELANADNLKFSILMSLDPGDKIDNGSINELIKSKKIINAKQFSSLLKEVENKMEKSLSRVLSADDIRLAKYYVYSIYKGEQNV